MPGAGGEFSDRTSTYCGDRAMISADSIVSATSDQVHCDLAGEAAILSLSSGIYFGLDPVGTYIWELLQSPVRVDDICTAVVERYDVQIDRCRADVTSLLKEMLAHELIEVRNDR